MTRTILPLLIVLLNCFDLLEGAKQYCITIGDGVSACGSKATVSDTEVVTFLGLPYAEPPVGPRRFQKPVVWKSDGLSYLNATKKPNSCHQDVAALEGIPQLRDLIPSTPFSEDCLYLNIWAPLVAADRLPLRVMVFIHGGGYTMGSGSLDAYNGAVLAASRTRIVVTMNYRLGVLGFGYLGTTKVPGNMGLLDQQMALAWIHDNIRTFGGDPGSVTIFGESAGSACVHAHMFSDVSARYFSNAICQSGTLFDPWAIDTEARARDKFREIAAGLGCGSSLYEEVHRCMLKIDPVSITRARLATTDVFDSTFKPVQTERSFFGTSFSLRVEEYQFGGSAIVGTNADEIKQVLPSINPALFPYDKPWEEISDSEYRSIAALFLQAFSAFQSQQIIDYYEEINRGRNLDNLARLGSDYMFTCGAIKLATSRNQAEHPVYVYLLDHELVNSNYPKGLGCLHGYDIPLVFGTVLAESTTESEKNLSRKMMGYWTDLSDSGPAIWPAVTEAGSISTRVLTDRDAVRKPPASIVFPNLRQHPSQRNCEFLDRMRNLTTTTTNVDNQGRKNVAARFRRSSALTLLLIFCYSLMSNR